MSAIRITFDSTKFGLKDLIIFLPGRLWGSSLSGGHVFAVAATDPRIAAVIAQAAMLSLMNANAPRRMAWRVMMPPKCSITGSAREVPQAMDASGALGLTGLVRIPRAGGVHAFPWSTLGGPVMGQAQELMRRITDAALAGDVKTLADCYAEDAVAETPDWGKLEITEEAWGAFMDDLRQTLNKFDVPPSEQEELKAIIESTHDAIAISRLQSATP